jgi:hypothetical protein
MPWDGVTVSELRDVVAGDIFPQFADEKIPVPALI